MAKALATKYKGIRYREHKTRKHGVRADRYHYIRYRLGGKLKEEGWGWESEGFTAKSAFIEREEIMHAIKIGAEIVTLKERREQADRLRAEKVVAAEAEAMRNITFGQFFSETYVPNSEPKKVRPELSLFKHWIEPVLGKKTFASISQLDMSKIKKRVLNAGRAKRTVQYSWAVVSKVYKAANVHKVFSGEYPLTKEMRKGLKLNNKKIRYLEFEESEKLLAALKIRSVQLHDMALVSLFCGLRAKEVFGLHYSDLNMQTKKICVRDTKNKGETRFVPMTEQVSEMLKKYEGTGNQFIFTSTKGERITQVSKTFMGCVEALGLNKNVTDRRYKATFHTLRHTCASWLVINGVPLYTVQKLLGHSSIKVTERYAHLADKNLDQAASVLSNMGRSEPAADKVVNINGD